jgi:ribosomal protein S18 acetylase RimI-like enzyme
LAPWSFKEGRFAVIHRLCVHPDFQGKGLAKKTMQLAQEMLKREGYGSIRLDTFSKNPIARRLYEHLGFSYVGEVNFRKGLFYLMEKALTE